MAKKIINQVADKDNFATLVGAYMSIDMMQKEVAARKEEIVTAMRSAMALPDDGEGTQNFECGELLVAATMRLNRKVDAEKLDELAKENGLEDKLTTLFRYKPEVSMTAWKAADPSITEKLLPAITTTAGSLGIKITSKEAN
jgi:hypothetical protein